VARLSQLDLPGVTTTMRKPIRPVWACVLGVLAMAASARAAGPAVPVVISSDQTDRFEAIRMLQQSLERNPKALADWVLLGELAHEVAVNLPADQARQYYKMSRDAYEKALALAPSNAGLKAAVRFAQEQDEGFNRFEDTRRAATKLYIDARRRELAATNYMPTVRTFAPPPAAMAGTTGTATTTAAPATTGPDVVVSSTTAATATPPVNAPTGVVVPDRNPAVTPARRGDDSATYGARLIYSNPIYLPYNMAGGTPYTYKQYSSAYYPYGYFSNQSVQPMTLQRYTQVMSQGGGNALRPVPVEAPGPAPSR